MTQLNPPKKTNSLLFDEFFKGKIFQPNKNDTICSFYESYYYQYNNYWILIWIDLFSQSCMMFSRKLPSLLCFLSGGGMQLKMNTLITISSFVDLGLRCSLLFRLAFHKDKVKLGLFLLSFFYFQYSQVFPSACQTSKERVQSNW